jgi:hypothetical protein
MNGDVVIAVVDGVHVVRSGLGDISKRAAGEPVDIRRIDVRTWNVCRAPRPGRGAPSSRDMRANGVGDWVRLLRS